MSLFDDMTDAAGAEFDPSERYRYRLWRSWGPPSLGRVVFVMLNPSTADAQILDPTVRRCVNRTKAWGFSRVDVVNLWPLRSTDPIQIKIDQEPLDVANENRRHIAAALEGADLVICAWGQNGGYLGRDRMITDWILECRGGQRGLFSYGHNLDGSPVHPLYLPDDQPLAPFPTPNPIQFRELKKRADAGDWPSQAATIEQLRATRSIGSAT